jgi:HEAT repeat protein
VRWGTADALGNIKPDTAVQSLINALKDGDSDVRGRAAEALGNIKSVTAVQPLINALKDEDPNVQWRAAKALGNIKPDTAVQLLIKALKDKDSYVRWGTADALGNIKSDTAVQPLVNVLEDEDSYVRGRVAKALGNIKSDTAVQPLISALKDENSYVRWKAAEALGEICTVKNKKQLEDLLLSDHEFSVNTAFEVLYEIEKEEKSEIILSENHFRMRRVDDYENCHRSEHVRPADEGLKDAYFGIFVDKLKSIKEPTTIIDYGCGEGKLLSAMTTLPKSALKNISYIGVDLLTRCRYISGLAAEKYGLIEKLCKEPEFLKPEAFFKKDILADYILFMHVLHEIELVYLPKLIHSFSTKVKSGGKILILDQKELVEKERSFVLWDEEEDFEMLFKDSGFEPHVRYFETGSGKKLSSIEIEKVEDKCFTREDAGRNCLAVYKSKQAKLIEKRKTKGLSDEQYSEISIQYTNISEQIAEYDRALRSEMN